MNRKLDFILNIVKLLLAGLFVFFAYRAVLYSADYFFQKLQNYGLSVDGLEFNPGKEIEIKFKKVSYKNRDLLFQGENGDLILDLVSSFKKMKPVFTSVSLEKFKLKLKEKDKGEDSKFKISDIRPSIPFYIKRLSVGNGTVSGNNLFINFKGLLWDESSFYLYPISGHFSENSFKFGSIKGKVERDKIETDRFFASYGNFNVNGKAIFSKDLDTIFLKGDLKYKDEITSRFTVKKNGEILNILSVLNYLPLSKSVQIDANSVVSDTIEVSGNYKFSDDNFSGNFKGNLGDDLKFELKGKGSLTFKKIFFEGIDLKMFLDEKNNLDGNIFAKKITFAKRYLEDFNLAFNLKNRERLGSKFSFKGFSQGTGEISGNIKREDFDFFLILNDFDFKKDPLIFNLSEGIRKWIPDIRGDLSLNGTLKSGRMEKLSLDGDVKYFDFRGFESKGRFSFKKEGNSLLNGDLTLSGDNGTLHFSGGFDYEKLYLNGTVNFKDIVTDSMDFLRNQGLKGKVSGSGSISGKVTSMKGLFDFYSKDFGYFTQNVGAVRGKAAFTYPRLEIIAESSDKKVNLEKLSLNFYPKFSLSLSGDFKGFELQTLNAIFSNYNLTMPVDLKGRADGAIKLNFAHGDKKDFYLNVKVDKATGNYKLNDFIYGSAVAKGDVKFEDGELFLSFNGGSKEFYLGKTLFVGGNYSLLLKKSVLSINGDKVSLPLFDKSGISFNIKSNLKTQSIDGNINYFAKKKLNESKLDTKGSLTLSGDFKNIVIDVKGKGNAVNFETNIPFIYSGKVVEPENKGNITIKTDYGKANIELEKNKTRISGNIHDFKQKMKDISLNMGIAFFDLYLKDFDIKTLKGTISVPVFTAKFKNYPEVFSTSGIFLNVKDGAFFLDNAAFAFSGGWFMLNKCVYDVGKVSGAYDGEFSLKTLADNFGFNEIVTVRKGSVGFNGEFNYKDKLDYKVNLTGKDIFFRYAYILAPIKIADFYVDVNNGKITNFNLNGNVAGGDIVVSGNKNISISFMNIPVGEKGFFKAKLTGNLKFSDNVLKGATSVSKVIVFNLPEKKKKKEKPINIPIKLDIDVNFNEPFVIKTDIWEVKILPSLKVVTRDGVPIISGNFFILGGWIDYMGKKFNISYGSGIINNLLTMEGEVNIASSATVNDYNVFLYVRGKLSSPTLFFASEPPLTKEEILSLIMTGATPSDIQRSNELFPVVQIAYYATSGFIKPIEEGLTKLLKLESFYLEPYITKYGETVIKFSLSKRLGKRIRLTGYQTTGQYPEYGFGTQYFIGRKNVYLEYKFSNYFHSEYGIGFDFKMRDWWWKREKEQ